MRGAWWILSCLVGLSLLLPSALADPPEPPGLPLGPPPSAEVAGLTPPGADAADTQAVMDLPPALLAHLGLLPAPPEALPASLPTGRPTADRPAEGPERPPEHPEGTAAEDRPPREGPASDPEQGPLVGLVDEVLDRVPLTPDLVPEVPPVPVLPAHAPLDREEATGPPAPAARGPAPAPAALATNGAAGTPVAPVAAGLVAVTVLGASVWAALATPGARGFDLLRRLAWLGLFSRISKAEVLDHDTRQALLDHLRANPGSCVTDLKQALSASFNTVMHHLRVLESNGLVKSVKSGRRRCFFAAEARLSPQGRVAQAALAAPATRRVYAVIARQPGLRQKDLAEALQITPTSVVFHTRRLEEAGVVRRARNGRGLAYFPADGAVV